MRTAAGLLLVLLLLVSPGARADQPPHPSAAVVGVDEHIGDRVPLDLAFIDPNDHPVRLRDTLVAGRPIMLVLAYSRCPMLCNLMLKGVADAVRAMPLQPGSDYALVTVSIDPDESRDMASRKQDTLAAAGDVQERSRWHFLRGEQESIAALASSLGFRYAYDPASGEYAHPAVTFILSPDGTINRYVYGVRHDPTTLADSLSAARRGERAESRGVVEAVLACFRFDPARRKYGGAIARGLQIGAVVIILTVTGGIVALIRRRRTA